MSFFYTKKTSLIGLDFQADELSLIHIKKYRQTPCIESFASLKLMPGMMVDGKIIVFDKMLTALRVLVHETGTMGCSAAFALPGSCVISKRIDVPHMLTEDEWEADIGDHLDNYLPGVTDEIAFDYYPVAQEGGAQQAMLIAAKKELVYQYVNLIQAAGLKVKVVDVDYNAFARALVHGLTVIDQTIMLLDVGMAVAHVLILKEKNLLMVKQITLSPITTDFMQHLVLQIQQVLQSNHASNQDIKIEKIYLSGRSVQLKNIQRYLTTLFVIPVEVARVCLPHSKAISKDKIQEVILRSMISVGLGLHGEQYDRN